MGIVQGGSLALLASVGPMGLGAIDYAIHNPRKPSRIVVTDIDDSRLKRAGELLAREEAAKNGIELFYVNTGGIADPASYLRDLNGGRLFDDVFVFAPVKPVIELADRLLCHDGCLNFFAGPTDTGLSAMMNFYNVHYEAHHLTGTSGGNTGDMREALAMMSEGVLNPVFMITHVGGLDAVPETTVNLDKIPGGKKLIYTNKKLELAAIADFAEKAKTAGDGLGPFYGRLAEICAAHNGLWSREAEEYLLEHAPEI
jgi:threonine dehydrogenase-like Zn-dependent dehydrogenase